jgi:hypothetical protein
MQFFFNLGSSNNISRIGGMAIFGGIFTIKENKTLLYYGRRVVIGSLAERLSFANA